MARIKYKSYIIDRDNLGRLYIYDPKSQYSEDSDHILVECTSIKDAKTIINLRIQYPACGGGRCAAYNGTT